MDNRAQALRQELLKRELASRQGNMPMSSAISPQENPREEAINQFKNATGIGKPTLAQNFTAGMINSLHSLFKNLPDLAEGNGRNPFLYEKGQSPIENFDAYKAMGTEDKPFYTQEGAAQLAGELFVPGKAIKTAGNAVKNLVSPITNAFKKINPEEVGKGIQGTHDALESKANDIFNLVEKEVQDRGIKKVNIDDNLIDDMTKYLPKTRASQELIDKAKTGDYSALRKAQSELWHRGTARRASDLPSERDVGEEILDLRDKINESIGKHFSKTGHEDLNNLLNEAKSYWKDLKETYYGDYVPNSITNLVQRNYRKVPNNLLKTLKENSVPMERIRNANPFVIENLENLAKKEKSINRLKTAGKVATAGGIGAGALYAGKHGFNSLTE